MDVLGFLFVSMFFIAMISLAALFIGWPIFLLFGLFRPRVRDNRTYYVYPDPTKFDREEK